MNVTQFLARLSRGPLSNLSISNDGNGTIDADRIAALIDHTNDALLRLYTRFDLSEKEFLLEQVIGRSHYKLQSKYAYTQQASNPTVIPHIVDSEASPFTDDLVKVLSINTPDGALPLNDDDDPRSLFTPQNDTIQIPTVLAGAILYVTYQAKHPVLVPTALTAEIVLPDVLVEAAISYAAHKVYFHMNGQEHAAKAAEHLAVYESVCREVGDRDLVSTSLSFTGHKFRMRGFV